MTLVLVGAVRSTRNAMGGSLMQELLTELGRRIEEMRGYL